MWWNTCTACLTSTGSVFGRRAPRPDRRQPGRAWERTVRRPPGSKAHSRAKGPLAAAPRDEQNPGAGQQRDSRGKRRSDAGVAPIETAGRAGCCRGAPPKLDRGEALGLGASPELRRLGRREREPAIPLDEVLGDGSVAGGLGVSGEARRLRRRQMMLRRRLGDRGLRDERGAGGG